MMTALVTVGPGSGRAAASARTLGGASEGGSAASAARARLAAGPVGPARARVRRRGPALGAAGVVVLLGRLGGGPRFGRLPSRLGLVGLPAGLLRRAPLALLGLALLLLALAVGLLEPRVEEPPVLHARKVDAGHVGLGPDALRRLRGPLPNAGTAANSARPGGAARQAGQVGRRVEAELEVLQRPAVVELEARQVADEAAAARAATEAQVVADRAQPEPRRALGRRRQGRMLLAAEAEPAGEALPPGDGAAARGRVGRRIGVGGRHGLDRGARGLQGRGSDGRRVHGDCWGCRAVLE